jgi:diguanylate cyclase (GGDEF)-like protein
MRIANQSEISRRAINDIKNRSFLGLLFYIPLFLIVVGSDHFYERHTDLCLPFGILISSVCLFRLLHRALISKRLQRYCRSLDNKIFFITSGLTGLAWGLFFACFMVINGEYTAKMLMTVCTAGICAGGIVAFIPSLKLAVIYDLAVLLPAAALMLIHRTHQPFALVILIYAAYLVFMATQGNREYRQAFENEQLLIKKSEELTFLARVDSLTGLYNRRYFDENIDHEWKKSSRVRTPPIVVIGDIDHFKKINDQFGHLAGDEFLKLTASLFKTVFQRDTDIVARFGGEEFVVLLTDSTPQVAFALAEDLRLRMSNMRMPFNGITISATLSIGIACSNPGADQSRDTLISMADHALYRAKRQGRNQTVVAPPVAAASHHFA